VAIPFVRVQARGSYRELGRAVGEAARDQVRASVAFFQDGFPAMTGGRLTFAQAELEAEAYGAQARRWLPQYVEELDGLAEGAGVPFSQLLVLNCGEELTSAEPAVGEAPDAASRGADGAPVGAGTKRPPVGGDRCTALAVVSAGRHVVGHNMDWYVIDAVNNVLFDLTVPDGTRLMGIAGAPYLLMLGMNSHGVANVSNSVYSTDNRLGIPNAFVRRWSIEAPTVEEARARGLHAARARGTNHFLADRDGRLWDTETSATGHADVDHSATGSMAHTNHYASPDMAPFEGSEFEESRVRLRTAERMLAEGIVNGDEPVGLVARVLRCHEPSPRQAICGHPDEGLTAAEQGMTVGSMICDLDERRLLVCAGPPCESPYQTFSM
jgi:isopenicillin-N N-acyltransferase like protein